MSFRTRPTVGPPGMPPRRTHGREGFDPFARNGLSLSSAVCLTYNPLGRMQKETRGLLDGPNAKLQYDRKQEQQDRHHTDHEEREGRHTAHDRAENKDDRRPDG